ncbi:MAG TPA: hypothetical protein VI776_01945 [Anaerolineales bacterium]|nr:hypothetical protein [Anaerolineales bacterium]
MNIQEKKGRVLWICLTILVGLAMLTGVAAASDSSQVSAERVTIINFEGLAAGSIVDSVSAGKGMTGDVVDGVVKVFGYSNLTGKTTNAAMIFDATCPPQNAPTSCTGSDKDLFKPELGKVLIVSEDLDSADPDDANNPSATLEFDFSSWGNGTVTVESLTGMDFEESQNQGNSEIDLYSGGINGTLLGTVDIPHTGNNGTATIQVGMSGVDFMRIKLNGSGAVDNIKIHAGEILYLSDEGERGDGRSFLYRVTIDEQKQQAIMTLLPGGEVNQEQVDTLASTINGARLYMVSGPTLSFYDLATSQVTVIGDIKAKGVVLDKIDQAAFSPEGTMYITGVSTENLYRLNTGTAVATLIGLITNGATGATVDIQGGDIVFTSDGKLYLWTLRGKTGAPVGLYQVPLTPENGVLKAVLITTGSTDNHVHSFRGMAVRKNGAGDLVAASGENSLPKGDVLHIFDRTGKDVLGPVPFILDGKPFNLGSGDMSIGPFAP